MNTYLVTLGKADGTTEWTLLDATTLKEDPGKDLIKCHFTGTMMRVVMRFKAPGWEYARLVFEWKARYDRKVPKEVLTWEEVKLLASEDGPRVQKSQEAPRPREVRLHGEDPGGRAG